MVRLGFPLGSQGDFLDVAFNGQGGAAAVFRLEHGRERLVINQAATAKTAFAIKGEG